MCRGERIHELLQVADRAWAAAAPHAAFGPRVRWRATLDLLRAQGVPAAPQRRRLRDCVLTVPWDFVAPRADSAGREQRELDAVGDGRGLIDDRGVQLRRGDPSDGDGVADELVEHLLGDSARRQVDGGPRGGS